MLRSGWRAHNRTGSERDRQHNIQAIRTQTAAMNITINQQATELHDGATVADALAQLAPRPPFAVAVNTVFVPRTGYSTQTLNDGDRLEVISPVTGG